MSKSYIFYNDYVLQGATVSHTVASGSFTTSTDAERSVDRSILSAYEFSTTTNNQDHTIEYTMTPNAPSSGVGGQPNSIVAILGVRDYTRMDNFRVSLKDTGATQTVLTVFKTRNRVIDGEIYRDYFAIVNGGFFYNEVVIEFDSVYLGGVAPDYAIGRIFVGDIIELKINPRSLKYSFGTQGDKTRTKGGQVVAGRNSCYMKSGFKSQGTKETDVIEKFFELNYVSSISEPIIFVPQSDENILMYGTQEKPNSTNMIFARDGASREWLYETQFNIEEEF